MQEGFLTDRALATASWQHLERAVGRLLRHKGFKAVRVVGQTGDEGADVLGHRNGKRWLIQAKRRRSGSSIGTDVVDRTVEAVRTYRADIPVVATNQGFTAEAVSQQKRLHAAGVPLQLWDRVKLREDWKGLPKYPPEMPAPRIYQEGPIANIVDAYRAPERSSALVIMATGLGKTFVAAEAVRRLYESSPHSLKVLVLAHTNELVYQLERAFWPLMAKFVITTIWNGHEIPSHDADFTFACIDSVFNYVGNTGRFPAAYDLVIVDECHHAGSPTYLSVLSQTGTGCPEGAFLLGLTATPWRPDGSSLDTLFGDPIASIDIVEGLRNGWLSNVDYRMHVDNLNWEELARVYDLTPRGLNRTIFIHEWDDAVVRTLRETWSELAFPRAIVFCGTIDHAITMRDRINQLGFTRAEALYSGSPGAPRISQAQRSRILADFHDGLVGALCAVDILNEGVDLPDVNIIVFQRVTHSRRIFVQQLGRGLRIAEDKEKVIVLDFVSDVRRFAAGLDLQNQLTRSPQYFKIGSRVRFMNVTGEDKETEIFLREWLEDVAAIEAAGDEDHILRFPPPLHERLSH